MDVNQIADGTAVGQGADLGADDDGRAGRPRVVALRAGCACGWRGAAEYPLDWATVSDRPLYEADIGLTGPLAEWTAHLSLVRDKAELLPEC
ncbi:MULTISPECIES: hypothetical protein [unclassified Streptomyces]|uniref:hypothetical protein n=1 Tax=unclassified Streptomyces TaxID=2593676 RepID=UPI002E2E2B22|nr:hypothetical protein [Streptomyces sp. NBC_00273]